MSLAHQIPLDVPAHKKTIYQKNYRLITKNTGRLLLLAGDQRVEHLNDDFYGKGITPEDASPEHLFKIAATSRIGAFATQLGYIARFGRQYQNIPYVVKLNSKSHLSSSKNHDPYSLAWQDVRQVVDFAQQSKLTIPAVGYTVYVGSQFESGMLREAAQIVWQAHQAGLLAILWMYPRGQAVVDKNDAHLIAGAVNVGSALGADFIKINRPEPESREALQEIVAAGAGVGLVFAGGEQMAVPELLQLIHKEVHSHGLAGAAIGRNLHQRPLREAVTLANALGAVIFDGKEPQ